MQAFKHYKRILLDNYNPQTQDTPQVDKEMVANFFEGQYEADLYSGRQIEGIRSIEVNRKHNHVSIFHRGKDDKVRLTHERHGYSPFLWAKELKFGEAAPHEIVKIDEDHLFFDGEANCDNAVAVLINGKERKVKLGEVEVWEKLTSGQHNSYIVYYKHTTKDEWQKYINKKLVQYDLRSPDGLRVNIKRLVTKFEGQEPSSRMEGGFKYLYYTRSSDDGKTKPKFSDNPYYNKPIRGSNHDLHQFFTELGLSAYGSIYFNHAKFITWFESLEQKEKYKYFFLFYAYRDNFNPLDVASVNKNAFLLRMQRVSGYKYHDWNRINSEIEKDWLKFYNKVKYHFSESDLKRIFNIQLDIKRIHSYVARALTFRDTASGLRPMLDYLRENDVCFWDEKDSVIFSLPPLTQYMIQTGRRMNKGVEDYEDMKVMVLDIETKALPQYEHIESAALNPKLSYIFEIGLWTNRGQFEILSASNSEEERAILDRTWELIGQWNADLILTHNGEKFDWMFIEKRMEILGNTARDFKGDETAAQRIRNILKENLPYGKDPEVFDWYLYYRKENQTLKVGGATEEYTQTNTFGLNYCDTMHAVARAGAQDKKIPGRGLKQNIIHANLVSKNRVYVDGDKIGTLSNDKRHYYFNESDGSYFLGVINLTPFSKDFPLKRDEKKLIKERYDGKKIYNSSSKLYFYTHKNKAGKIFQKEISSCDNTLFLDYSIGVKKTVHEFAHKIKQKLSTKKYDEIIVCTNNFYDGLSEGEKSYVKDVLGRLKKACKDVKNIYDDDFSKLEKKTGSYIVKRYLLDDIVEPYNLDKLYSQNTFLVSKLAPTSYQRIATMGGASSWKFILATWSFLSGIAVPDYEVNRDYGGGLLGATLLGFCKNGFKVDFRSLYPSEFLGVVKRPSFDITGIFHDLLDYILTQRLDYKRLKIIAKQNGDKVNALIYDKKQMPLKLFANTFYGMLGAALVSMFADILSAHHITCSGRQDMRHIIRYFTKRGFVIIYFHTDGANFTYGDWANEYEYVGKGKNTLVEKGRLYKGIPAYVAEYNDKFMRGKMGLDIDEFFESCINFAKGNFVYLQDGEFKYTGGAVINKSRGAYLEDFGKEHTIKLLKNNAEAYLKAYFDYCDKIYYNQIPVGKIATPHRIKKTPDAYLEDIKGSSQRQAKMEIVIKEKLNVNLGDKIYLVNNGKDANANDNQSSTYKLGYFWYKTKEEAKAMEKKLSTRHKFEGWEAVNDLALTNPEFIRAKPRSYVLDDVLERLEEFEMLVVKTSKHVTKKQGEHYRVTVEVREYKLNVLLVEESDFDTLMDYNSEKFLAEFKKATMPYKIAFKPSVREKILSYHPTENRPVFSKEDYELVNGIPLEKKEDQQHKLEDVLPLDPLELSLWKRIGQSPNFNLDKIIFDKKKFYKWDGESAHILESSECKEGFTDCGDVIEKLAKLELIELEDVFYKIKNVD